MTHRFQTEFLLRWLREEPGTIVAAVVPAGAGTALIQWLTSELASAEVELVDRSMTPLHIGARAEELGRKPGVSVLLVSLEGAGEPDQAETIEFWRSLNFQRERLASGNVRTCLVLPEDLESAFAVLAKDLWDWTTFFRLPEALALAPRLERTGFPESSPESRPDGDSPEITLAEFEGRKRRWLDAGSSGLPEKTVIDTYALPLFSAAVAHDAETALRVWHTFRHLPMPGFRPEANLRLARDLVKLAGDVETDQRAELVEHSLEIVSKTVQSTESTEDSVLRAKALAVSSEILLRVGKYKEALADVEASLSLWDRVDLERVDPEKSMGQLPTELRQRRADLRLLLQVMDSADSEPSARVHALLPLDDSEPGAGEVRQEVAPYPAEPYSDDPEAVVEPEEPDLGRVLGRIVASIDGPTEAISPLLAAWVLSSRSRLFGPTFEQILRRDPVAYCRGLESLWDCPGFTTWKDQLIEPLAESWAQNDELVIVFRPELERWILQAKDFEDFWSTTLEALALRVFGERYDPTLIPLFCRHLAELPKRTPGEDDSERGRRRSRALERLGFLLRWSYQEAAIPALLEVAEHPESTETEVEAARSLAAELLLEGLPKALRTELFQGSYRRLGQDAAQQLAKGEIGIFEGLSPDEFPHDFAPQISALAGDRDAPDLHADDLEQLVEGLSELIQSGLSAVTFAAKIYDSWMPWVARCSVQSWWRLTADLLKYQAENETSAGMLRRNPILGFWHEDPELRQALWRLFERTLASAEEGEKLRTNGGLTAVLRWMVLSDGDFLVQCLDELASCHWSHSEKLVSLPIPDLLGWFMDRSVFDHARNRRQAATDDHERHHWFVVEHAFAHRLPADEALAWCKEVLPLVDRLREWPYLFDRLKAIDSDEVLIFLMTEPLLGDPSQFQKVILDHVFQRGDTKRLAEEFPEFLGSLHLLQRGRYLAEIEDVAGLRAWGEELTERTLSDPADLSFLKPGISFPWIALCDWARLETDRFLHLAQTVSSWEVTAATYQTGPLRESILLAWQVVAPDTSLEARESMEHRFGPHRWTGRQGLPLFVDMLWSPRFSDPDQHQGLRLRYLSRGLNDIEIAWHGLAARRHRNHAELEQIGRRLLASERQLDRQLAVSLLAWHPKAEELLQESLTEDPSLRVREHVRWAVDICRRDRLGLQVYREALDAEDWLHQQARLEMLRPLLLPTFTFWHNEHPDLDDKIEDLPPERRALWHDFWYRYGNEKMWQKVLFRDLKTYCRGEDLRFRLTGLGSGPPWERMRELVDG